MSCDFSVYEVGPRDGLQALEWPISLQQKVKLISLLHEAGLHDIEVGSFVHPDVIPNMADSGPLFEIVSSINPDFSVLVPNLKGFERARTVGARKFNIFLSPDEQFNHRNLGCNLEAALDEYRAMLVDVAREDVRVYVSMAFACPVEKLEECVSHIEDLGSTIVLSDTDGRASPDSLRQGIGTVRRSEVAIHLHQGTDDARMENNLTMAFDCGVRQFDSSIGGLGGCPFVVGSRGNLATS